MPAEPSELLIECPACDGPRLFEKPPCTDGHGLDCPEWACTGCGTAVLLGHNPGPGVTHRIAERHAA